MSVAFAPRATAPVFANATADGTLDDGSSGNSGSASTNSIVFNNTTYKLNSVQIACNPASSTSGAVATGTHKTWLLDQTVTNTEDVILIFSSSSTNSNYKYIVIVVPIIRTGASTPPYLQAIATGTVTGTISLNDCMPSNKRAQFAYYSTCLNGYSDYAETQEVYVFVSISGINASSADMAKILTKRGAGGFTAVSTPFGTRLSNTKTSINVNEFSNYILTTTWLLDSAEFSGRNPSIMPTRTDNTGAYKCTQLNPDRDVDAAGNMQFDLATGNLLTDILAERQEVISSATGANDTAQNVEKSNTDTKRITMALGILMAMIFVCIIIYLLYSIMNALTGMGAQEMGAVAAGAAGAAGRGIGAAAGAAGRGIGAAAGAAGRGVGAAAGAAGAVAGATPWQWAAVGAVIVMFIVGLMIGHYAWK